MICLICRKAELVESYTTVDFERDEFKLVVNEVPARICPNCWEAFVDENVAAQLLSIARQKSEAGMLDAECKYGTL
jgi:YgiT-type zinc finger domain-containing protein